MRIIKKPAPASHIVLCDFEETALSCGYKTLIFTKKIEEYLREKSNQEFPILPKKHCEIEKRIQVKSILDKIVRHSPGPRSEIFLVTMEDALLFLKEKLCEIKKCSIFEKEYFIITRHRTNSLCPHRRFLHLGLKENMLTLKSESILHQSILNIGTEVFY